MILTKKVKTSFKEYFVEINTEINTITIYEDEKHLKEIMSYTCAMDNLVNMVKEIICNYENTNEVAVEKFRQWDGII